MKTLLVIKWVAGGHYMLDYLNVEHDDPVELYRVVKEDLIPQFEAHAGVKPENVDCVLLNNVRNISLEAIKNGNVYPPSASDKSKG